MHGLTRISTDWASYQHSTDSGIAAEIFERHLQRPPAPDDVSGLRGRFVELLRQAHADDPRHFAPTRGVNEALRSLAAQPGWAFAIATGGWEASARLKLAMADIDVEGLRAAFADDHHARWEIVRFALARAQVARRRQSFEQTVYVGDARWDLHTATKLGIGFVGIGEGERAEQLRLDGAACVLPDFASYSDLIDALQQNARSPKD